MKHEGTQKITITLPHSVYHRLRREAIRQEVSLPEFVKKKIQLRPCQATAMANLPLKQILALTTPKSSNPDDCLDFFAR